MNWWETCYTAMGCGWLNGVDGDCDRWPSRWRRLKKVFSGLSALALTGGLIVWHCWPGQSSKLGDFPIYERGGASELSEDVIVQLPPTDAWNNAKGI